MSQTFAARCLACLIAGLAVMQVAGAQSAEGPMKGTTVKLWTAADLNEQGKRLLTQAKTGNGSAGAKQTELTNQYTMLTTRSSSGGAELHSRWCDYLVVLDGEGVELTGGSIVDQHDEADGEVRGVRLEGAESHALHKGDILFISAGTPHQAIEPPGKTLTLFVIKSAAPSPLKP